MSNIVTRAQFIEACPPDLKKRIDDFFVFYSQKKKQGGGPSSSLPPSSSSSSSPAARAYQSSGASAGTGAGAGASGIRKANLSHFKKPFEKAIVSEFDTAHVSFKGILSKLNENNQDSVWKELQALKLEKFVPVAATATATAAAAADDDGWTSVVSSSHKKSQWGGSAAAAAAAATTGSLAQVKDLAQTMYLYSRNCHMYIKEYIELVSRFKQSHEWQMIGTQYIEAVMFDLDNPKAAAEQHQYNAMTHSVCSELFLRGLMTKTKYIECCLVKMGDATEAHTEILIQNMTKCGPVVAKNAQVVKLRESIDRWIKEKKFSGKIHFNLIDLQDTF